MRICEFSVFRPFRLGKRNWIGGFVLKRKEDGRRKILIVVKDGLDGLKMSEMKMVGWVEV